MTDFRVIPSIEQLRQREAVRALEGEYGRETIVSVLREAVGELRRALGGPGGAPGAWDQESAARDVERRLADRLAVRVRASLRPVVNATGVIVHTNLGRAPLAPAAAARMAGIGAGSCNLEYDLDEGRRGARDVHAEALLCRLLGVEAAVVVNNNAAATLLMLAALAAGREVVVSRGELVEIGGGFRVPDVMEQSGARLREVGTTNRTRVQDYAAAITERTALLLRVHRSNFRIEGFTEQPALDDLVALGRERGIPVAEDLGSGYLGVPGDSAAAARLDALLGGEPTVQRTVAAGVGVCCFSGDKLLGGPQAGILVGRGDLVAPIRRHPLMRALRVDKTTYAALEATLAEYVAGRAARSVPTLAMILATPGEIEARARRVSEAVGQATSRVRLEIVDGRSTVGGGTTPGLEIPTRLLAVTVEGAGADGLAEALRHGETPVVARIEDDRLVLDLRSVLPEQDATVAWALERLDGAAPPPVPGE